MPEVQFESDPQVPPHAFGAPGVGVGVGVGVAVGVGVGVGVAAARAKDKVQVFVTGAADGSAAAGLLVGAAGETDCCLN